MHCTECRVCWDQSLYERAYWYQQQETVILSKNPASRLTQEVSASKAGFEIYHGYLVEYYCWLFWFPKNKRYKIHKSSLFVGPTYHCPKALVPNLWTARPTKSGPQGQGKNYLLSLPLKSVSWELWVILSPHSLVVHEGSAHLGDCP